MLNKPGTGGRGMDLRCESVESLIAGLPDGCAAFLHCDAPWKYTGGTRSQIRGLANSHYPGLPDRVIAEHVASAFRIAAPDCYLALWCTFPKLVEWLRHTAAVEDAGWVYVSGGAWGKTDGLGVGYHFRGDAELLLLYRRGHPRPRVDTSNLWLADRGEHSEKPQVALRALVAMAAPPGGLVVDLYAGASASLARACRALGREYVGAEIDPARHALALQRLSQQEMFTEAAACAG